MEISYKLKIAKEVEFNFFDIMKLKDNGLLILYHSCTKHIKIEPRREISNNVVCATNKGSDQHAHTPSLIRAFAIRLNILRVFSYCPNIIWSF